ncbi:hypothetical protein [Synechocystis salina]|uniref:hypothetical protein n=1 Tax=Synechocystis salina TaxID=945780 RepID=UPI001D14F7BF|nr:hypothetical protein [Synechocystis salina]
MPSLKEGITRLFDVGGAMRDDFSVNSVRKKSGKIIVVSSRSFNIAATKINQKMIDVEMKYPSLVQQK